MKILHINTNDQGGAAKAVIRLHKSLLTHNIDSKVLTLFSQRNSILQKIYPFHYHNKSIFIRAKYALLFRLDMHKKKRKLKNAKNNYEIFSFPNTIYNLHKHPLVIEADIIHLHWIGNFLDYKRFFKHINKPIIWTLHDMNPFSGGFHYANDSLKNKKQFESLEKKHIAIKQKALQKNINLTVVCTSQWMYAQSKFYQVLKKFPHYIIPCGINLDIYRNAKPNVILSKEKFKVLKNKKIILFVADNIQNSRKGFRFFEEASKLVKNKDAVFVVVGQNKDNYKSENIIFFDFMNNHNDLASLFKLAKVHVTTALEEAFGQTIIEAFACGTPVIGFDTGGIKEIIKNNKNGYLVEKGNIQDLANKIMHILTHEEERKKMEESCLKEATEKYSLDKQTKKYLEIYESILS